MGSALRRGWLDGLTRLPPSPFTGVLEPAQALWLLSLFAKLYRRPVDASLLARECVPPFESADLERVAAQCGMTAVLEVHPPRVLAGRLAKLHWPLALELHNDDANVASGSTDWVMVLEVNGSQVVVGQRRNAAPESITIEALGSRMTGASIRLRPRPTEASDPDATGVNGRPFGFRWFVPELLKHHAVWREVVLASVVLQLLALSVPLFTQTIIDKVIVHRTHSTLIALSVGMAVFLVFTSILTWVRQYLILHTGRRVDAVLGSHVFDHLFKLPLRYFHHRPTGVVAARMQGIETIREFISSAGVTVILDLPFLLIFVAIMFWYSFALTAIVLGILAVIVAASLLVAPLFQVRLNEQFLRGAANQAFMTEYVAGMETVKSLQLEPQLNRRYRDLLATFLESSFRARQLSNTYGTFANALEQVMTLLILVVGARIVMTSTALTIGMLVAFQMFSARVSQPMLRLVGLWQQFQQARLALRRLGDIMNAPGETYRLERTRTSVGAGAISISGLSFSYGANLPLLFDQFVLEVAPGQLIAVMGPSGAGKSTLSKLLQGFHVPTAGLIRIDGVDVQNMAVNELRAHFGIVPQETTLFSGTILDNMKIAAPFASFEQVVAACRMAEIHSAIERLPGGYQTEIGERGAGLSGGQRQRLSIARALLKGPRILIFDEATVSLDPSTAEQVARTINSLKPRATILFIAHALPKALQVDHIVRIGGKLAVSQSDGVMRPGPGQDPGTPNTVQGWVGSRTPSPIAGEGRGEGAL